MPLSQETPLRTLLTRQRAATAAVLIASVAVLAACGEKKDSADPSASPSAGPAISAGAVLISDGTAVVRIGDQKVTFPTTVKDAAWSPDGSRIAFVDGDGNISTSRPDGSARVVLTKAKAGFTRSEPTWFGYRVLFTETDGKGVARLLQTGANGSAVSYSKDVVTPAYLGPDLPETGASQANAVISAELVGETAEVAYVAKTAKSTDVWVIDVNQREPYGVKIAAGTDPALSPDGKQVAYVARDGQVAVAKVEFGRNKAGKPTTITTGAQQPSHLVWSADGQRVAYSTPTGIESVAATGGDKQAVSSTPGVAAYLPVARDKVARVTGTDPVATAIAASKLRYPTMKQYMPSEADEPANGVVLASAAKPEYALVAAQLAWAAHGPLLLTSGASLDAPVEAELKRLFGTIDKSYGDNGPTVYLVGGEDVLSAPTAQALKKLGFRPERITGADPIAVAASAAKVVRYIDSVLVVDGKDPKLAAAVAGVAQPGGLIFTDGGTLPAASKAALQAVYEGAEVYVIGSAAQQALAGGWPGKSSKTTVTKIDAEGDSAMSALAQLSGSPRLAVVADPAAPLEVAIAVSLAHSFNGQAVFAGPSGVDDKTKEWLVNTAGSIDTVYVVGAGASADAEAAIATAVSGPLGYTH
ncbi:cell wall-binding repeat-containing protein [Hamadaea sp. NPDC050747]|uniref:cell wall-binding repeat-containing protein n=1 Tax=Hamadaea sp. NPDC050747 TaxID=3155789 RepID=UPI0033F8C57D